MSKNTPNTLTGASNAPEDEDLKLLDEAKDQDQQENEDRPEKESHSRGTTFLLTVFLIAFLSPLGFLWWSSIGYESPWTLLEIRDAGNVLDVSYLHGLGTRTVVKTSNDLLLLEQAVRIEVGTTVVLQRNSFAERLCIQGSDRCWYVVNR